jgi:hypothetical protein
MTFYESNVVFRVKIASFYLYVCLITLELVILHVLMLFNVMQEKQYQYLC